MLDPETLLDPDPLRRPPYLRLLAEAWSLAAYRPAPPPAAALPHGSGRTVLVIPAFLTGDISTQSLRAFLQGCGFRPFGWGLGVNWGPTPRILAGLERQFDGLAANGPIAVVGVSLGGILARNLAYDRPGSVSHVVTVASPFRLPAATTIGPLVRLCARSYSPDVNLPRLRLPLPVPSTMICTRDDGIVDPDSCWTGQDGGHAVHVDGPHLTVCRNPDTLRAIVAALAGATARQDGTAHGAGRTLGAATV